MANAADGDAERLPHPVGKLRLVPGLVVERLHDLDVAQRFTGMGAHIGQPVLAAARQAPHPAADQQDGRNDEGGADHHDQGQLRIGQHQQHDAAKEHQHVAQRDGDRGANHRLQQGGVGGDAALDLRRAVFLEERRMQADEMVEHRQADVGADPLADPRDEVEAHEGADGETHHEHGEDQDAALQQGIGLAGQALVDHQAQALAYG